MDSPDEDSHKTILSFFLKEHTIFNNLHVSSLKLIFVVLQIL